LSLVLERIQLLHDLLAALPGVELERLERRPVVFLEAMTPRHVAPGGEDVIAESEFFGVKVAKPWQGLSLHRNNLRDRREAGQAGQRVADGVKRSGDDHGRGVDADPLERALEPRLEFTRHRESAQLALQPAQVPAPLLGRRVGDRAVSTRITGAAPRRPASAASSVRTAGSRSPVTNGTPGLAMPAFSRAIVASSVPR